MRDLDLNQYSDREIVSALFKIDMIKLFTVTLAINTRITRAQRRAEQISGDDIDTLIQNMLRDINGDDVE